jgi:hypothetical protein
MGEGVAFGISGANTTSPFDSGGEFTTFSDGVTTGTGNNIVETSGKATSNANDMIIGFVICTSATPAAYGSFTTIQNGSQFNSEYEILSATNSNVYAEWTISGKSIPWLGLVDAIQAAGYFDELIHILPKFNVYNDELLKATPQLFSKVDNKIKILPRYLSLNDEIFKVYVVSLIQAGYFDELVKTLPEFQTFKDEFIRTYPFLSSNFNELIKTLVKFSVTKDEIIKATPELFMQQDQYIKARPQLVNFIDEIIKFLPRYFAYKDELVKIQPRLISQIDNFIKTFPSSFYSYSDNLFKLNVGTLKAIPYIDELIRALPTFLTQREQLLRTSPRLVSTIDEIIKVLPAYLTNRDNLLKISPEFTSVMDEIIKVLPSYLSFSDKVFKVNIASLIKILEIDSLIKVLATGFNLKNENLYRVYIGYIIPFIPTPGKVIYLGDNQTFMLDMGGINL